MIQRGQIPSVMVGGRRGGRPRKDLRQTLLLNFEALGSRVSGERENSMCRSIKKTKYGILDYLSLV